MTRRKKTPIAAAAVFLFISAFPKPYARSQTQIRVGRTTSGSGFHVPSYVAMDRRLFKAEGLDASFVATTGVVLVRAAIAKELDFVPISAGGAEAILKGAPLVFVVGQSLISQWTIMTAPGIKRVEDLKGKTLGLGRPGAADYSEFVLVLGKFFKMKPGRDYKVVSFAGENERIEALLNGSIQGAALSFPHAARVEKEGMRVLVRTGDHLPRLGGAFLTHRDLVRERRDTAKRFIRAIARAADYIRANQKSTVEVIQKYFDIADASLAESIYRQVHDQYSPDIPPNLLQDLFESRATPELGWPAGKALPDVEPFVARDLLNETLKEIAGKSGR